jgi:SAM-dependent methyltransferase
LAPSFVKFAEISDAGQVLDIGSGIGALAFSIAVHKPHCRVLGIDTSNEYVCSAKSNNPFGGRVRFETGDAQELRFADGSFHASLSLLVFNFIPDYRKALRQVVRVTKQGGCLCAAVWDYGGEMQMLRTFWDAVVAMDPSAENLHERSMPLCREGELQQIWKQAGLRYVVERPLEITMPFSSFSDYWDPFLLGQGPAGAYLKNVDDRRGALRAEVKRRLNLRGEDSPFSLTARAWAVRGVIPNAC